MSEEKCKVVKFKLMDEKFSGKLNFENPCIIEFELPKSILQVKLCFKSKNKGK